MENYSGDWWTDSTDSKKNKNTTGNVDERKLDAITGNKISR